MEKELTEKILKLKKDKNAVILAHYYQIDEIQSIADIRGDSLALAIEASKTNADMIVFCGVRFMAETAKVLCPDRKVITPEIDAICPLANMATKESVLKKKQELGNPVVVSYVNTTVDVKTVSDICCTSANAVNVVKSLDESRVLFVPDRNLGDHVREHVKDKEVILWDGYCPVHEDYTTAKLEQLKQEHPNAKVAVHPESPRAVRQQADFIGSTSGILKYVSETDAEEFIIGTEQGILYELKLNNPNKRFYIIGKSSICENMKKITLESLYRALKEERYEIKLDQETIEAARKPIERMIAIKRS